MISPRGCKPSPGIGINWSHPLARGLTGAWLMNAGGGSPIDIVTRRLGSRSSAAAWVPGSCGLAVQTPGVADFVRFGTDVPAWKTGSISVVILTMWDGTANAGNSTIISSVASSTGYELCYTSGHVLWWAHTAVFAINNTTYTATANVPFLAVLSYDSAVGTRVYVDGVQVATNATTGALTYSGTHNFQLGQRGDGAVDGATGSHFLTLVYNRGLSAFEAQQLTANPYAMIATSKRRRGRVPTSLAWVVPTHSQPNIRRIVGPARFGAFAFVPVISTAGGGVERIVLGQKESFSTSVNPSIGSGALFG